MTGENNDTNKGNGGEMLGNDNRKLAVVCINYSVRVLFFTSKER